MGPKSYDQPLVSSLQPHVRQHRLLVERPHLESMRRKYHEREIEINNDIARVGKKRKQKKKNTQELSLSIESRMIMF